MREPFHISKVARESGEREREKERKLRRTARASHGVESCGQVTHASFCAVRLAERKRERGKKGEKDSEDLERGTSLDFCAVAVFLDLALSGSERQISAHKTHTTQEDTKVRNKT